MIIKTYMANEFDRVRNKFLNAIFKIFGFNKSFISWIGSCIYNPWISPLVNGRLALFFTSGASKIIFHHFKLILDQFT
jgi:hypothetical protein